jgi:hypothetical protein
MLQKYFIVLLSFFPFSIQAQSCLCTQEDDEYLHQWYEATAPSGLIVREGPGRNTAKLGVIPLGVEVLCCEVTAVTETIEGISGNWIKVPWMNQPGYVFGGFLKQIEERKVRMIIPNAGVNSDWECMELSPGRQWDALMDVDTSNKSHLIGYPRHLSSVNLKTGRKKTEEHCALKGYLDNAVLNVSRPPFAVFSGFTLANKVENKIHAPIKLMPGEIVDLTLYDRGNKIKRHYIISAEGHVFPNPNFGKGGINNYRPIDRIEHYKINLHQQEIDSPDKWKVQKLVNYTAKTPGDSGSYKMNTLYIYFAGDLDGDNELDLILADLTGIGRSFKLYLSSAKLPGFLLRYMAAWHDAVC